MSESQKRTIKLVFPAGDPVNIGYKEAFSGMSFEKFLLVVANSFRQKNQPNIADTISSMVKKNASNEGTTISSETPISQLNFQLVNKGGQEEGIATVRFDEVQSGGKQ